LSQLDGYLASLYDAEDNHILDVEALLSPEVTFLAAARGESVIGCGAFRRMPAEAESANAPYAEVKRMFVLPEARGQRIAERLLVDLERRALAQGLKHAFLETGRDQHEALRLYERTGYVRCAAFGGYPDNGLSVFMSKAL
jgi:putative acetyltransferase